MAENPFHGLTPEERVHIARLRLAYTKRLMHEVITLMAQRIAFTTSLRNVQLASDRAVTTLLVTILYFEVLQVCRLWDPPELSGYSIPSLVALTESDDVQVQIAAMATAEDENGEGAMRLQAFHQAVDLAKKTENSEALRQLKNHRHKMIAHAILKTRDERRRSFPEKLSLPDELVATSIEVMAAFTALDAGEPFDYGLIVSRERGDAKELFWNWKYKGPPSSQPFGDPFPEAATEPEPSPPA